MQDTAYTVYRDDADEDTCYRVSAYDTSMNFSEEAEFCYVGQAN